jgi:hypothetical protein
MRKITTAALAGAMIVPAFGHAAGAASSDGGATATYDGRQIDLADGWQGAHACAVLSPSDVRCYDSQAEMKDALGASAQQNPAAKLSPLAGCVPSGTFVTLYSGTGFGGDSLSFAGTGGWANLAPYGFDNDMESWQNTTNCGATVADGTNGGGAQLTLAARSSSSNVGTSWKNRASSINVLS